MCETPSIETPIILQRCRQMGFALSGVCDAEPTEWPDALKQWLADGMHGEMAYLANHVAERLDPACLLPDARSIICVADRYASVGDDPPAPPGSGRIGRYARGRDYHRVIKKRLHQLADELRTTWPQAAFKVCVDTAPILEREHAQRAGLGSVGKHTLLIEPGVGSYLLLGEIVTNVHLQPSTPSTADPCESCRRCIDACPTDAITPWKVDARACISYLTIEHRSLIDQKYHQAMDNWIFGCDICQEVCPHNQPTRASQRAAVHDSYASRHDHLDLLTILGWDEQQRRQQFTTSAMKRARLNMMKRNALIAAGNYLRRLESPSSDALALIERIRLIAADRLAEQEDPMVVQTATEVLSALAV